jgi:hypothetical protein
MKTFAERIISFYNALNFKGPLPGGVTIMNPIRDNSGVSLAVSEFYKKFYSDNNPRHLILGINPGRFGAGVTGIPFTDTIRLKEKCGITIPGLKSYETSSVFIYEMINHYGGPEKFYSDFYISSVSPLGFKCKSPSGKEINYNYYDSKELFEAIYSFAIDSITKQLQFGLKRNVCFCLGTGKNFKFLSAINNDYHFFDRIEPLEHPRFIMQYKLKSKQSYIENYLEKFKIV